jgi:CheY-like chemotaxis protein
LTELMGGRVWVESELGRGSSFHATIAVHEVEGNSFALQPSGEQTALAGVRVWIVDDNDTNRRTLLRQLQNWGMQARDTASPAEALVWAGRGDPCDLAILDYHMPEMNGAQLAQRLRGLLGEPLKRILLTPVGSTLEPTTTHDRQLAQIAKPLKQSTLFDTILKLFERRAIAQLPAPTSTTLPADLAQRHPLRILVAEDNPVNVKLIEILLGRMGYRVDVAGNGLEVLAALKRQWYDVVLMDVQMPQMDGTEATRQICRESGAGSRPRIIALTAAVMLEERRACLDAGMDDFLIKPINPQKLVDALTRCSRVSGH